MKKLLMAVMLIVLIGMLRAQTSESKPLPKEKALRYWSEFILECENRIFLAENIGAYWHITEYKGKIIYGGTEHTKANGTAETGVLVIKYDEYRMCEYNVKEPQKSGVWTQWMKPMWTEGGSGYPYKKKDGKLMVEGGVLMKPNCNAVAIIDHKLQKEASGLGMLTCKPPRFIFAQIPRKN